jgi:superoxide reductase
VKIINMTKLNQIYKCSVCGNIIQVIHASYGTLVCCDKPMILQEEKSQDQGNEKHVPVIEKTAKGFLVKVGSIEHPMEKDHFIEFIELIADGQVYRQFLKPGDEPQAEFCIKAEKVAAREYCNLHGLWKSK